MKKTRKKKKIKKSRLIIFLAICCLALFVFFTAAGSDNFDDEKAAFAETLERYEFVVNASGVFDLEDNTASSITEDAVNANIENFCKIADMTFDENNPWLERYKKVHANEIRRLSAGMSPLNHKDICFDTGVSDCRILSVNFHDKKTSADVKAVITTWSRMIRFDGGQYSADVANERVFVKLKMKKSDSLWKISDTEKLVACDADSYDKNEVIFGSLAKKELFTTLIRNRFSTDRSERAQVKENVQQSINIMNQEFDTFAEAKEAALKVDTVNGNYYAIY